MLAVLERSGGVREAAGSLARACQRQAALVRRDLCELCWALLDRGLVEIDVPLSPERTPPALRLPARAPRRESAPVSPWRSSAPTGRVERAVHGARSRERSLVCASARRRGGRLVRGALWKSRASGSRRCRTLRLDARRHALSGALAGAARVCWRGGVSRARFVIGAAASPEFLAHAWVEHAGEPVLDPPAMAPSHVSWSSRWMQ